MSFTGKCILVTGASGGIGSAIVQHLVHLGATVGIHYHRETEEVLNTIKIIQRTSPNSIALQADLTNWDESKDLVTRFVNHTGQIDGLVNNAGAIWAYGAFDRISEQDWDKTYAINVRAAFETMTSAWEYFAAQNGGRVVNISSASVGYNGSLRSVHYISAKAALESVSTVFAKDGAKHNILVNVLRLGLMDTPMHFRTPGYTREHLDSRAEIVPLGRMGSPIEAAKWVAMLLGEDGSFMTGQIIGLTGGD